MFSVTREQQNTLGFISPGYCIAVHLNRDLRPLEGWRECSSKYNRLIRSLHNIINCCYDHKDMQK